MELQKARPFFAVTILMLVLVLTVTACKSDDDKDSQSNNSKDTVYTIVTEGTLKPGDSIPVPESGAILTITGSVSNFNVDESIVMDIPTIESVGVVSYTVTDPFEETKVTYTGVLMSDLLKVWGVDDSATTLSVLALNDYQVEVPIKDVRDYPVIFAMKSDGEYMPISTRGPAMLVFPYDDFEFDKALYNDYWAWQIKSIDVH